MKINPAHTAALMSILDRRPYFALLGMKFRRMDPGYCRIDAAFSPSIHGNAFGAVHGGAYASLIDSAAYWALYCQMPEEQGYTSLDLNVTNLAAVRSGVLITEARVVRAGRSISISQATVKDETGRLLAYGTSKLMSLEGRQSISQLLSQIGEDVVLPPKFLEEPPAAQTPAL